MTYAIAALYILGAFNTLLHEPNNFGIKDVAIIVFWPLVMAYALGYLIYEIARQSSPLRRP